MYDEMKDKIDKVLYDNNVNDTDECMITVFTTFNGIGIINELNTSFPEIGYFKEILKKAGISSRETTFVFEKLFKGLVIEC